MSKVRALHDVKKPAPALDTPTDLSPKAVSAISAALNAILADTFRSTSRPRTSTGTSAARIFATIICSSTSTRT